jgi:uncharacterized DUF497 family protein
VESDQQKAESNRRKHKISFEEARTVFYDDFARLMPDPDHSAEEDRFIILGRSSQMRLWLFAIVIERMMR